MRHKILFQLAILIFVFLVGVQGFSQNPIERMEPPNWWAGMKHNSVELLAKSCGASTVCGSCKPLLADLCGISPERRQKPEEKKKLTFKERKELDTLEDEIGQLEDQKSGLMTKMNSGEGDHEELLEWSKELERVSESLEEKELRWLELSEYE